jgi:hypothetical protein
MTVKTIYMKSKILSVILFLGICSSGFGQQNSMWDKWRFLIGEWKGEGEGTPGSGNGTFSFKLQLDKNILVRKSHSEFLAKNKKDILNHDDLMIIYTDHTGIPSKAIYFDNEGHTINYSAVFFEKSVVLTSEKGARLPVFRITYTQFNNEEVDTQFEMSDDGVKFKMYVEGRSKRVRSEE